MSQQEVVARTWEDAHNGHDALKRTNLDGLHAGITRSYTYPLFGEIYQKIGKKIDQSSG